MSTLEAIKPELEEYFSEVDLEKQKVLEIDGRTDRDFIDENGRFSERLKKENKKIAKVAKDEYYHRVINGLERVAVADTIESELDRAVLFGSLRDGFSGFEKIERCAFVPGDSEEVIDQSLENVSKYHEVFNWWQNPSELFVHFKNNEELSLYHSNPDTRIELKNQNFKRDQLYIRDSGPSIQAKFNNGVTVEKDQTLPQRITRAQELIIGLYGWDGNRHVNIDHFKGDEQNSYLFLNNKTIEDLSSNHRFSLTLAQEALANTVTFEPIEIPSPDQKFSKSISNIIASSVIQELLGLKPEVIVKRSPRRTNVSLLTVPTEITNLTKPELQSILRAANITTLDQAKEIDRIIKELQQSTRLSEYFDGIKVEQLAERFKQDILDL